MLCGLASGGGCAVGGRAVVLAGRASGGGEGGQAGEGGVRRDGEDGGVLGGLGASAGWCRAGSPRLLRRRGSPPGVVSTASAVSAGAWTGTSAVAAAGAAAATGVAGVAAGSGLKYLCGTTTTTEVPSQGESAKVTRMP
ncbi:hypothetical protein SGLAM104S_06289 [Streptomyces glaucescens]